MALRKWVEHRGPPCPCPSPPGDLGEQRQEGTNNDLHGLGSSDRSGGPEGRSGVCELVSVFLRAGCQTLSVLEEAAQARGNVKCLSLLGADITSAWEQSACSCRACLDWQ